MTELKAYQHIFANVEADQSPRKIGGYQTLFYTKSVIEKAESIEMEARLTYPPSETKQKKHIFFVSSAGRYVISQILPLEGADFAGRTGGRLIAHSLVFEPDQFYALGGDPFRIFRQFDFIDTVEKALKHGNYETGEIGPTIIKLREESFTYTKILSDWSDDALRNLILLAHRAKELLENRATIVFLGQPEQVEDALIAATFSVPTPLRKYCAFDIHFPPRSNPATTNYWAIGLQNPPSDPRMIVVDTQSRQISKVLGTEAENDYERWVLRFLDEGNWETIALYRDHAYNLIEYLKGNDYEESLMDSISPEVLESIYQINKSLFESRIKRQLDNLLPPTLASYVMENLIGSYDIANLFDQMRKGFELPKLMSGLYEIYRYRNFRKPGTQEIRDLGKILQHTENTMLRLVHEMWSGDRKFRDTLGRIDEESYRDFIYRVLASKSMEPFSLLVRGKGRAFLDVYLESRPLSEIDFLLLFEALFQSKEWECLDELAGYVDNMKPAEMRKIQKLLKKQPVNSEAFGNAIDRAVEDKPGGLSAFLLRLSRKKKNDNGA